MQAVLQIHKIIYNNTLSYLKDKLPPNCREMFCGNNRTTFHAIICKFNRFVLGIILWKFFYYKGGPSIDVIKNDITSLICPKSKGFFQNL